MYKKSLFVYMFVIICQFFQMYTERYSLLSWKLDVASHEEHISTVLAICPKVFNILRH